MTAMRRDAGFRGLGQAFAEGQSARDAHIAGADLPHRASGVSLVADFGPAGLMTPSGRGRGRDSEW
jgi:hypothetical protein